MKNKTLWLIVLAAVVGLLASAQVFRDKPGTSVSSPTPSPSASPIETPRPSVSPVSNLPPATCRVSGEIRFISGDVYETLGAKIVWQNIDDKVRQIFWKSDPDDGILAVGPNLFERLDVPNGEKGVGVALNGQTAAESYILTASVNYGVNLPNGDTEIRTANCAGRITVTMPLK